MKKIVVFIVFSVSVCAYTQSFKLYELVGIEAGDEIADESVLEQICREDKEGEVWSVVGEFYAILENTSNRGITVVCKREIIRLAEEAETYFCWSACNGSDVSIDEKLVAANTQTGPFDFSTHYTAPFRVDSSIIRYVFYDKNNMDDCISVVFKHITAPDLRIHTYMESISLTVYPNPATDYLTVEVNDLSLKQTSAVLYDAIGRKVKTQSLPSPSTTVDVTNLEQGIYYLQIVNDNQTLGFRKFVKE